MNTVLILALLSAVAIPALAQQQGQQPDKPAAGQEGTFVHTVFFWLKAEDSKSDHQKLYEGLKMLGGIPEIQKGYIGVPAPTDRPVIDSSYDFSITFVFEDLAAQEVYQTHPIHLKFVEEYSPLWERVLVYDAVDPEH